MHWAEKKLWRPRIELLHDVNSPPHLILYSTYIPSFFVHNLLYNISNGLSSRVNTWLALSYDTRNSKNACHTAPYTLLQSSYKPVLQKSKQQTSIHLDHNPSLLRRRSRRPQRAHPFQCRRLSQNPTRQTRKSSHDKHQLHNLQPDAVRRRGQGAPRVNLPCRPGFCTEGFGPREHRAHDWWDAGRRTEGREECGVGCRGDGGGRGQDCAAEEGRGGCYYYARKVIMSVYTSRLILPKNFLPDYTSSFFFSPIPLHLLPTGNPQAPSPLLKTLTIEPPLLTISQTNPVNAAP